MNAHGPFDPSPSAPAPRAGVGADQALAGLRVSGPGARGGLDRFRLGPATAGALRAAVDCLAGDDATAPIEVMADESALEVRLSRVDPDGLIAAGGVIEAVEGNVGPTPGVPGSWSVRLPLLTARETFLMIERGGVPLALPWHAVSRVRLMTGEALAAAAAREGLAVVSPLGLASEPADECPAVLVGLGLRRAYVLADRLVWRMTAEPIEPPGAPPDARLGPALRAGEDGVFWLIDPSELLREVPMPSLPRIAMEVDRAIEELTGRPAAAPVRVPGTPAAREPATGTPSRPRPILRLIELRPSEVDPLGEDDLPADGFEPMAPTGSHEHDAPAAPAPAEPPVAMPSSPAPAVTPVSPGMARAPLAPPVPPAMASAPLAPPVSARVLVAEDSITAGIFLERLLQQHGFTVRTVGTAGELRAWLAGECWDLVLADVDLPDAHGARWLQGMAARRADGAPAPLVALVRDDEDATLARSVGILHALRKPFERDELEHLLAVLGLPRRPRPPV